MDVDRSLDPLNIEKHQPWRPSQTHELRGTASQSIPSRTYEPMEATPKSTIEGTERLQEPDVVRISIEQCFLDKTGLCIGKLTWAVTVFTGYHSFKKAEVLLWVGEVPKESYC